MKKLLAALVFLAAITPALAQPPSPPPTAVICGWASLAVTTVTGQVTLPSTNTSCNVLTVYNDGATNEAFFAVGGVSITATLTSIPIPAGKALTIYLNAGTTTTLAALTGASTTTLRVLQGNGPLPYY